MHPANDLQSLQLRIRTGDRSAVEQFRKEFLPALKRVALRATSSAAASPLNRAIRNLAAQFEVAGSSPAQPELQLLAGRLCDLLIQSFQQLPTPNRPGLQTINHNAGTLTTA